jgi:hypothetical protein
LRAAASGVRRRNRFPVRGGRASAPRERRIAGAAAYRSRMIPAKLPRCAHALWCSARVSAVSS